MTPLLVNFEPLMYLVHSWPLTKLLLATCFYLCMSYSIISFLLVPRSLCAVSSPGFKNYYKVSPVPSLNIKSGNHVCSKFCGKGVHFLLSSRTAKSQKKGVFWASVSAKLKKKGCFTELVANSTHVLNSLIEVWYIMYYNTFKGNLYTTLQRNVYLCCMFIENQYTGIVINPN